ncbi:MAG: protein kinase [Myxococcales bacterium]|nr:protein kinase [Myxococcales bacterium]MCB9712707.1 protein kinase [Myxococcales bacterium]
MNQSPASSMAGTVLDHRYRILRLLKAGGMGTVYEGEQLRLGKRVAIKVLRPEATYNEAARRRFEREAKLASRIRHRNVVDLLDFGVQDDTAYYVMELLEGRDLSSLLHEEGRLPWDRARPILLQIARGLAAAHRLGIVHRDVKPGNCFLVAQEEDRDEEEGQQVKVLDFGIAKLDPSHANDGGVTRTSELVGTVAYMSPEQAQSQPVDARSDVYSLGVLAYQVLTGERPFHDDNVFNLLLKHMNEPPPPLRALDPSIPEPVEAAVLQALAKEPAARFPSMDAFRAALTAVPPAVVGSTTAVFVPEIDGVATIPLPRGASLAAARAAAEAARAAHSATQVLATPEAEPEPIPLKGNTEEQPILSGETTIAPTPSGSLRITGSEPSILHTAIAPAFGPEGHSRPTTPVAPSAVAAPAAALDRRLVFFVLAGALSLMVGVGLGVWLVKDDASSSTDPPSPAAVASEPPAVGAGSGEGSVGPSQTDMPSDPAGTAEVEAGSSTAPAEAAADDGGEAEVEVAPAPTPTPRSGKRGTKAAPRPPSDAKVKGQLERRARKRCASLGASGTEVRVSLSIDPEGAITLVRVEAPHQRDDLGKCVRTAVADGRFPGTGERRVLSLSVSL